METRRGVTALLVDDDPATRKLNEASLKDKGYLVTVASEARSALELVEQYSPAVIFLHMDARESGRSGLISALRANDSSRHVPIVFLKDRKPDQPGLTPVGRDW